MYRLLYLTLKESVAAYTHSGAEVTRWEKSERTKYNITAAKTSKDRRYHMLPLPMAVNRWQMGRNDKKSIAVISGD